MKRLLALLLLASWPALADKTITGPITFGSGIMTKGATVKVAVPDNATLLSASTTAVTDGVWRLDFAADNGASPLFYRPSNSPCSLNSGNGDNGYEVKSADGKCWLATGYTNYDVKQFGAIGNGANDDTSAIVAAIASAAPGCGTVYFPQGHYLINSMISFPNNSCLTVKGDGRPEQFVTSGQKGTMLDCSGLPAATDCLVGGVGGAMQMLKVEDLQIQAATQDCLHLIAVYSVIQNVTVTNCGRNGVTIISNDTVATFMLTMRNMFVALSGANGISIQASVPNQNITTILLDEVYSNNNTAAGVVGLNLTTTTFLGGATDHNGTTGYNITGSFTTTFIGTDAEQNALSGYYISGSQVSMFSPRGAVNNTSVTSGHANLVLADNASVVAIHDASDVLPPATVVSTNSINGSVINLWNGVFSAANSGTVNKFNGDATGWSMTGPVTLGGDIFFVGIPVAANCTGKPSKSTIATTGTGVLVQCP